MKLRADGFRHGPELVGTVVVLTDDDEARAKRRIAEYFGNHYGVAPDRAVQVSITGNPAKCVEGLNEVIEAGAGMLMLNPAFDYQRVPHPVAEEIQRQYHYCDGHPGQEGQPPYVQDDAAPFGHHDAPSRVPRRQSQRKSKPTRTGPSL